MKPSKYKQIEEALDRSGFHAVSVKETRLMDEALGLLRTLKPVDGLDEALKYACEWDEYAQKYHIREKYMGKVFEAAQQYNELFGGDG